MDALLNYGAGSDSSGDEQRPDGAHGSEDSSDVSSSEHSVDSAQQRAAAAAARLKDYGDEGASSKPGGPKAGAAAAAAAAPKAAAGGSLLPSALDVFNEVRAPSFLDPEAIRQLPVVAHHGRTAEEAAALAAAAAAAAAAGAAGGGGRRKTIGAGGGDIAKLAPPLKGQGDKRPGAVIEGKAKRYKPEDGPEGTQQYTAAQIAMLGGKLPVAAAAAAAAAGGEPGARHDRGKATAAMPVQDFLDKGLGGAQLPRKQQDRKEREKQKRQKGQSTHAEWKPESWMVLRQQYDG